jgi:hypothetical protein
MRAVLAAALGLALVAPAAAQDDLARRQADAAQAIEHATEDETVLPDGEGRHEVFAYCTACHNTSPLRRTRLSREGWDGLMDWMTDRHGMTPLRGDFRDLIVDYLALHFGPQQQRGRGRNPFLD